MNENTLQFDTAFGPVALLRESDTSELEAGAMDNGSLVVKPASFYENFSQNQISRFCHKHGLYCLPTTELIEWLSNIIEPHETIEVGSGNGCLGRSLGITLTDSHQHEDPIVILQYAASGQPTCKYGRDVVNLDGIAAIKKFRPKTVVGAWITDRWRPGDKSGNQDGIDGMTLVKMVWRYILIGHVKTHGQMRIMRKPHEEFEFPWLYSRSLDNTGSRIYIWDKNKKRK